MGLEEELRKRKKSMSFSPIWKPENEGDEIYGKITRKYPNPWEENKDLTEIETSTGERLTLPTNVSLERLLDSTTYKIGDYVLVEYTGEQKSKRGRTVKTFELAVITAEEAEKLKSGAPSPHVPSTKTTPASPPKPDESPEPPVIKKPETPQTSFPPSKKEDSSTKQASEEGTPENLREIKLFVDDLFKYYPSLSFKEFEYYLNVIKKFGVDTKHIIEVLGLTYKDDKVSP